MCSSDLLRDWDKWEEKFDSRLGKTEQAHSQQDGKAPPMTISSMSKIDDVVEVGLSLAEKVLVDRKSVV